MLYLLIKELNILYSCQETGDESDPASDPAAAKAHKIAGETTGQMPWDFQHVNCRERNRDRNSILKSGRNQTRSFRDAHFVDKTIEIHKEVITKIQDGGSSNAGGH